MKIDTNGWLSGVRRIASPNYDRRPPGTKIDLLVIHNISLPPDQFGSLSIVKFFTNQLDVDEHPYYAQLKGVKVSSHFLIRRDGQIVQFVPCRGRAWHAGVSDWQGRARCNDFSLGVELEGSDFVPFTDLQYSALARLTRRLQRAYPIRSIAGHSDIAPVRKTDPGPYFDWPRYQAALGLLGQDRA
ncbi:MAG TPA: 1,6-anhydro-N-acetylmuramyl-L-alanine amidase AmpD [Gallionellaceae bacterium]|nr:1,6-anhydro-N-acetylmuramyl-L-alanine amidase AmpD [Gallionellaceae bacterium]